MCYEGNYTTWYLSFIAHLVNGSTQNRRVGSQGLPVPQTEFRKGKGKPHPHGDRKGPPIPIAPLSPLLYSGFASPTL